jgi:uncharacterized protein
MFRSAWLAGCALLALTLAPAGAGADVAIPPVARVTDLTATLTPAQQQALSGKLAGFEQSGGSQLAVLILPSTKPETIEQYGIRLAEAWKLGRKGADDGAILIVAKDDRRLRIEVGYGLEGVIPDAVARRIIDETITPKFKAGDFYGGIDAGLDRMMCAARGESPAAAKTAADLAREQAEKDFLDHQESAMAARLQQQDRQDSVLIAVITMVFCSVFGLIFALVTSRWLGRAGAALLVALVLGGAGYFAGGLLHAPALVLAAFSTVLMFVLSHAAIAAASRSKPARGRKRGNSGSGSGGSSSTGSSSTSSDSFSGGGGGFGGGGASGSW